MPRTLLLHHAQLLLTMDEERREIPDGAVFIEDNRITQVGPSDQLPDTADEVLDMILGDERCVVATHVLGEGAYRR